MRNRKGQANSKVYWLITMQNEYHLKKVNCLIYMTYFNGVKSLVEISFNTKKNPPDTAVIGGVHHLSTVNYEECCRNF